MGEVENIRVYSSASPSVDHLHILARLDKERTPVQGLCSQAGMSRQRLCCGKDTQMTKEEATVELLKPMMQHLAQEYRIASEPEVAAEKIARFVIGFKQALGEEFDSAG
jgi:hypothetical protein